MTILDREVYLICRKIGPPLNKKKIPGLKDLLNHETVREDGYCPHLIEVELLERKGSKVCGRILQRGSLRINVPKEANVGDLKQRIIKNLDNTLGKFKHMAISMILPPAMDKNDPFKADLEAISLAVTDRKERITYFLII